MVWWVVILKFCDFVTSSVLCIALSQSECLFYLSLLYKTLYFIAQYIQHSIFHLFGVGCNGRSDWMFTVCLRCARHRDEHAQCAHARLDKQRGFHHRRTAMCQCTSFIKYYCGDLNNKHTYQF